MENSIQIEVHETVEDFKENYKHSSYFIRMPIILLFFLVLSVFLENDKNSNFLKIDPIYKIGFGIFAVLLIIGVTIYLYFESIKNFKKDLEQNPNNHNYIIRLYIDHLEIEQNEKQFVEYSKMKIKRTKNHFFITYRVNDRIKVCFIKKSECSQEAVEFLERIRKK